MDRRLAPRFTVHLPISFLGYNLTGEGIVVNLSLGGCAVESEQNIQQWKYLTLRIFMPDQDAPLVVDRAQARSSRRRRLLVLEFLAMQPQEQARLRHFVSTLVHAGRSTGTEMILVVEDDPTVRAYVREVLTVSGYQVLEAAHSEEALRLCSSHAGAIHLLLTDVVMPGINGRRLAELVAAVRPETQVLFMSGYPKHATIRPGSQDGRATLLQKPLAPDQVRRTVREVLDTPREGTA